MRDEGTALHKAGQYEEAVKAFTRAAEILERAVLLAPPPALSSIRLSLAAAQLKVGDISHAIYSCIRVEHFVSAHIL